MANNNQTDAEYLVSCMFGKPLSEYTPEELKEYYEDMNNEMLIEEQLMKKAEEKEEEYEPEYGTDYEHYLDDEE